MSSVGRVVQQIAIAWAVVLLVDSLGVAQTHAPADADYAPVTASSSVPIDSWVYAALGRLTAWGYVDTAFLGLRPWTREECARLVEEAADKIQDQGDTPPEIHKLVNALHAEFADELSAGTASRYALHLDSVYSRALVIHGRPLTDSYHFGQTLINDFGRPYASGFNQVAGFSARASAARFTFYVRAEYQHAPAIPAYSQSVRDAIAEGDGTPVQPPRAISTRNQLRVLEGYIEAKFAGLQFAVGKQALWWGPGEGGAMTLSTNAEPLYMLRISRTSPVQLPSVFAYLGPMQFDSFFGRLAGHQFPPRPFFYGQKISFKPTPNLEFGFSRTVVFAGAGVTPLTFSTFFHSFFSTSSGTAPGFDLRRNPGARHAGFDFSYRVPFLRHWLTIYSDSIVHDDVSPVSAPRRAAINPGLYLSHFPRFPRLDLRVEAVNTDPPTSRSNGGKFIYWEGIYRDAYLNDGNLLGNWIGREGKGGQAWLTYWLDPASKIQLAYRHAKIAKDFIPGGATQNDVSAAATLRVRPSLELATALQYERWNLPVIASRPQSNVSLSVQLTWFPKLVWRPR